MSFSTGQSTLGSMLSPAASSTHRQRSNGRFGYQMLADAISFAHNIPQRLLISNQLQVLPKIVFQLLREGSGRKLIEEEVFAQHQVSQIQNAGHRSSTEARLREELSWIDTCTPADCQNWCQESATLLCQVAELAWHYNDPDSSGEQNDARLLALKHIAARSQVPSHWYTALETLLPHVERKIWLTELSAALPAHAICRMHDPWAALVLFWSYQHRGELSALTPVESLTAAKSPTAFCTEVLKFAVAARWEVAREDPLVESPTASEVPQEATIYVVVGPFLTRDEGNPKSSKPHLRLAQQFRKFMEVIGEIVPAWEGKSVAMPSMSELMDAYDTRFPVASDSELELRVTAIGKAWSIARSISIDQSDTPSRDEWETLGALSAWVARWEHVLIDPSSHRSSPSHLVSLPRWVGRALRIARDDKRELALAVIECDKVNEGWLEALKHVHRDLDLPLVLWNRLRERQNAAWAARIVAIDNLMQRQSIRREAFSTEPKSAISPHLLLGVGGRLCRHVANISHAQDVVAYWLDYSEDPPRLKMVSSYSRSIENRARLEEIQEKFDSITYSSEAPDSACRMRTQSRSMLYRTAARNAFELWTEMDDGAESVTLDAYSGVEVPRSIISIPLQAHGRVIGVLELAGTADRQFSKQLRSPLRRVAAMVGPTMYDNMLLMQLGRINDWVVNLRPFELDEWQPNRLARLAKLLCNVFACPVVQIWTRSPNALLFDLEGRSREIQPEERSQN